VGCASTEVDVEGTGAADVEGLTSTTDDGLGTGTWTVKEGNADDGEGGATGLIDDDETDKAMADTLAGWAATEVVKTALAMLAVVVE
jgi:hypothetical protein